MKQRHILVVNVFFSPFSYGGATVVAEQVAAALVRFGTHQVSAVSLCARSDLEPYCVIKSQKNGIDNYLINVPTHRKYAEMYQNPEITQRLSELIQALEPDLVHAHCLQEIGTGIITSAKAANVPVILSVHDFWWLCERQFMVRPDEKYCEQDPIQIDRCRGCVGNYWAAKTRFDHLQEVGSKVACVTYPSQFAKDLSEASGFATGKGLVWTNGVQLPGPGFEKKQAARRLRDPRVCFGYVGGPASIKGWLGIRAALQDLEYSNFRGLVVDGSLDASWWTQRDLMAIAGEWEIYPRFEQADMDDFYAEIDVLLFMSQWKETFGLAIREALARGIKVIQTDSGGTVEHGTIPRSDLIPIGAPSYMLKRHLEKVLSQNDRGQDPVTVTSVDSQARAFARLVDDVMDGFEHAI